jgi:hypothetical protein
MYVNPFPFGVTVGVVGTILVEIILIVIAAACSKGGK